MTIFKHIVLNTQNTLKYITTYSADLPNRPKYSGYLKKKLSLGVRSLCHHATVYNSQMPNIESDNSQNGGLEGYNNISDGIFPNFTTPSIKISLG